MKHAKHASKSQHKSARHGQHAKQGQHGRQVREHAIKAADATIKSGAQAARASTRELAEMTSRFFDPWEFAKDYWLAPRPRRQR